MGQVISTTQSDFSEMDNAGISSLATDPRRSRGSHVADDILAA
jgi:hypothetical protein